MCIFLVYINDSFDALLLLENDFVNHFNKYKFLWLVNPFETNILDYEPEEGEYKGNNDLSNEHEPSRNILKAKKSVRREMEWQDKKEIGFTILVRNMLDIRKGSCCFFSETL